MLTLQRVLSLFVLTIASVGLQTTVANAAPIQSFSITYGSGLATGSNLSYSGNTIGAQDVGSSPNIMGNSVSNMAWMLTGTTTSGLGPVDAIPNNFTIGGTTAQFTFNTPPSLQIGTYNGAGVPSFTISGEVYMSQLDTNFGFGNANSLDQIWIFTFTSNGVAINDGTPGSFLITGSSTASATFVATGRRRNQEVPEPMTLATLGLIGVFGGATIRRRLKKASV